MARNVLVTLVRSDLRLHDHPIFSQCAAQESASTSALANVTHVLPVYVFDQQFIEVGGIQGLQKGRGAGDDEQGGAKTRVAGFWRCGEHRTRYITESVFDLKKSLQSIGSDLSLWAGQSHVVLSKIVKALQDNGDHVHAVWMCKEPHTEEQAQEQKIRRAFESSQTPTKSFHHRSLIHPQDLPFSVKELPDVFTQFRKRVEGVDMYRTPVAAPSKMKPTPELADVEASAGAYPIKQSEEDLLQSLLAPIRTSKSDVLPLPEGNDVDAKSLSAVKFRGGETEALKRLDHYFTGGKGSPAFSYKETRNGMLGADYSTKFSAALSHGTLSPRLIAHRADEMERETNSKGRNGGYWIVFELLWRDYFYFVSSKYGSKLYTLGGIEEAMDSKTAQQKENEWKSPRSLSDKKDAFVRWARFETGVPLIDANMKELALTGFMSNRGRQNVASLLTKDLYYDWRLGAEWFESQLIDHDPASNYGNWQYVAGVGNDPRSSRQFNPIKQGKDYDLHAEYIKTWLPLLSPLSANDAHHPWTTSNVPEGYPSRPVTENPMWRKHYSTRGGDNHRGGIRGNSGGGGRGNSRRGRGGR